MNNSIEFKKQGDQFLKNGNLPEAHKYYTKAVELNPIYTDALIGLGFVLCEQEQYIQAKETLEAALKQTSQNPDIYFLLSNINEKEHDFKQALSNLEKVIQLNPKFEFAHRKLFEILTNLKNFSELKDKTKNAVKIFPDSAEFRFHLAQAYYISSDYNEAIEQYKKVIILQSNAYPAYINLGNSYAKLEMYFDAMRAYNDALKIDSNSFDAYLGLAKTNDNSGYPDISLENYNKCIELKPNDISLYVSIGNLLYKIGDIEKAILNFNKAIDIDPKSTLGYHNLGNLYYNLKKNELALAAYKKVLEINPEHLLSYLVSTMSGTNLDTAPQEYVEQLFDQYAVNFDESLVAELQYNAPWLIKEILEPFINPAQKLDILDLGCGTGLMGEIIKKSVKSLVGVDLSSNMLKIAENRNIYTRLEKNDILNMLTKEKDNSFDLIVSADVFIYIGNINSIMTEAFRLIRKKGLFTFSVESLEHNKNKNKGDFYLHEHARYAHSFSYIKNLVASNGFKLKTYVTTQIRVESGEPVIGYIFTLEKI